MWIKYLPVLLIVILTFVFTFESCNLMIDTFGPDKSSSSSAASSTAPLTGSLTIIGQITNSTGAGTILGEYYVCAVFQNQTNQFMITNNSFLKVWDGFDSGAFGRLDISLFNGYQDLVGTGIASGIYIEAGKTTVARTEVDLQTGSVIVIGIVTNQ